jgi:hypothetical protein
MAQAEPSTPLNPSMGTGFDVYLITDEQLKALQDNSTPFTSSIIAMIESQHIGQLRGFTNSTPIEARGILLEYYRKALSEIETYVPPEPIEDGA